MKTTKNKLFLTSLFCYLQLVSFGQTFDLNYKPVGKIIKIKLDSVVFFTDTTALFNHFASFKKEDEKFYYDKVKKYLLDQFEALKTDTFSITETFIQYENTRSFNGYGQQTNCWFLSYDLYHLIRKKKVLIIGKNGDIVKKVKRKRKKYFTMAIVGIRADTKYQKIKKHMYAFSNKQTNELLWGYYKVDEFMPIEKK